MSTQTSGRSALEPRLPIAVIGAACRLPGASDLTEFWELLLAGRDAVGEVPPNRFPVEGRHRRDPAAPDPVASRTGGFLDGIDEFDAGFFNISPHEAMRLDPQHRLLMEVTWEALEDAGLPAEKLAGSDTAVYTGCLSSDYWDLLRHRGAFDLHSAIGSGTWGMPAGRISHQFDLRGPSMGVEAACATSLLAVHLACDALRSGQSDLAIVASVNLLLSHDFYLGLSEAQILSPRGRSRFADAEADGYVRSEGVVSLILKPLPQAIADGDQIYASILGSAVSNNGSSAGTLIASGREGQEAALRGAYRAAGVSPADVDYVEAHGPGTPLGDATELAALCRVLSEGRAADQPCLVGSVKSNIGHTEVAAGAAGLLKTMLALRHRTVPATLHVRRPRAELRDPKTPLRVARTCQPWPERPGLGLAGVSSFGLSGVNTHLVLREAPPQEPPDRRNTAPSYLLPLSARDPLALQAVGAGLACSLATGDAELIDVCFSAGARRSHHTFRAAVVGSDRGEMAGHLRAFSAGERHEAVIYGETRAATAPRVVFVFSGHGAQWVGMGRALLRTSDVFAGRLHECDQAIRAELGWSLIERLASDEPMTAVDEVQPALWAMQVCLAALWRDWGIEPDLVIGHSMGEVAAAVTSGALSLADGARVICRRSRLIRERAQAGGMWAVQLGESEALELIAGEVGAVSLAAVNSDHSCVLAGEVSALLRIAGELERRGVHHTRLEVGYASHAAQVEPVGPDLGEALQELEPGPGTVPMRSTVTGEVIDGIRLDAGYWMANLRLPVRFSDAVRATLTDRRPTLFVEINAHPSLLSAVEDCAESAQTEAPAIPSLMRGRDELDCLLTSLAQAYVLGCDPRWETLNRGGRYVRLPSYPWQRRRYWMDPVGDDTDSRGDLGGALAPAVPSAATRSPAIGLPLMIGSAAAMTQHVLGRVCEALAMSPVDLDLDLPLNCAGMDSLLASRIARQLRLDLGVSVPPRELLDSRPLTDLATELFHRLKAPG